jgi:hypothetical protein
VVHNFQTRKNKIKQLMEYESATQKSLFGNTVLAALMSGRKYVIPQNGFSKQSPLSKRSVITECNMEKIHLQIMLSDIG